MSDMCSVLHWERSSSIFLIRMAWFNRIRLESLAEMLTLILIAIHTPSTHAHTHTVSKNLTEHKNSKQESISNTMFLYFKNKNIIQENINAIYQLEEMLVSILEFLPNQQHFTLKT